ncbi:four-carbon acid sugar kinase family protein [Elioraea rosea]|uniref:four-carbon acid sugar kinase family protein n=1 Tax=Elioraea rosea TaxID=2492390 RepID=UPI001182C96C|nr:four-carbon acid sugar kinase family protein [Elioraea rosea]
MTGLRLLADDLTGALDASAPFAAGRAPITVAWLFQAMEEDGPWPSLSPEIAAHAALSSASRDLPHAAAVARVQHLSQWLADGSPAFKKIDSLLRGNTAAEIVAAHRFGRFERTVVCPAFPAQGRLVRGGRLIVRTASGDEEEGPDLSRMLQGAGAATGLTVCDAADDAALEALVEAHRGDRAVLWAGSSGLARALAGDTPTLPMPRAERILVVTASRHPVAQAQIAALRCENPERVLHDDGDTDPRVLGQRATAQLASGESVVLDAAPASTTDAAASRMSRCFAELRAAPKPDLLAVIGGDTLASLLAALGCSLLSVRGEIAPGLPLAGLVDGVWAGTQLLSRSGAFDDGGTIAGALAATTTGS